MVRLFLKLLLDDLHLYCTFISLLIYCNYSEDTCKGYTIQCVFFFQSNFNKTSLAVCLLTNYPYQLAIIELAVYSRPRPAQGHLSTADTPNDHIKAKYLKYCLNIYNLISLDVLKVEESFKERNYISRISSAGFTTTLVGHILHYQRHILPCEKKTNYFSIITKFCGDICHIEH